jgi:hypothetical protein
MDRALVRKGVGEAPGGGVAFGSAPNQPRTCLNSGGGVVPKSWTASKTILPTVRVPAAEGNITTEPLRQLLKMQGLLRSDSILTAPDPGICGSGPQRS